MNNRIYKLAWAHYRETQCHDRDPATDEMFLAYLMAQEKPQTFRYLRAVVEPSSPSYLAMVEQLEANLRTVAKMGLSRKTTSAELVALGNQARDLETAFAAFQKELEHDGKGEVPDGQRHPGNAEMQPKPRVRRGRTVGRKDGQTGQGAS